MSHFKERKEKNCLNCGTEVQGRFCHVCGQENIEPKETAWHLVTHFFNDITHFDGKFFSTLKFLIAKPGFISKEYMRGRRAAYLNPVRMYIFTSAIFFLVFFSLNHFDESSVKTNIGGKEMDEIQKMDSTSFDKFTRTLNHGKPMSKDEFSNYIDTSRKKGTFHFATGKYNDRHEYDSLIKAGVVHDNWLERRMVYKQIELNKKYQNDGNKIMAGLVNELMHSFPQMLFISLPLLALILKLLYIRRKSFYYTNHLIFGVHLYIFVFIILLLIEGLSQLKHYTGWNWINFIFAAGTIYIFYYQYKAMRRFYEQGRGKTILKYSILNASMIFVIAFLIITFFFLSYLKM